MRPAFRFSHVRCVRYVRARSWSFSRRGHSGGVGGLLRPLESIGDDIAFSTIRLRPLTRSETHELVALLVDLPERAGHTGCSTGSMQ